MMLSVACSIPFDVDLMRYSERLMRLSVQSPSFLSWLATREYSWRCRCRRSFVELDINYLRQPVQFTDSLCVAFATDVELLLHFFRPHRSRLPRNRMRPIVTDGVAWSDGLSRS